MTRQTGNGGPCCRRRRERGHRRGGFSLVELIAVIAIILILVALLVPAITAARRQALVTPCASNLHQIAGAFHSYLIESHGMVFWRGEPIQTEGMDLCTWGGRETGNRYRSQEGLFNRIIPRPLNHHLSNKIETFRCPSDMGA